MKDIKFMVYVMRKKTLYIAIVVVLAVSLGAFVAWELSGLGCVVNVVREYRMQDVAFDGNYQKTFHDVNDVQLVAAKRMGIQPLECDTEIAAMVDEGRLHKISSCRYYRVRRDCKYPYLTMEAADLLAELGRQYKEATGGRLVVTSALRTTQYVSTLQKSNVNATKNSCHLYGTTFDITYARMDKRHKDAFANILCKMRAAGYCFVIHEVRQQCFHITVSK